CREAADRWIAECPNSWGKTTIRSKRALHNREDVMRKLSGVLLGTVVLWASAGLRADEPSAELGARASRESARFDEGLAPRQRADVAQRPDQHDVDSAGPGPRRRGPRAADYDGPRGPDGPQRPGPD